MNDRTNHVSSVVPNTLQAEPNIPPESSPQASRIVLLRVDEVANLTGLSVRSVWRKTANGDLPRPLKLGRATRWRLNELVAYLEAYAAIGGVR